MSLVGYVLCFVDGASFVVTKETQGVDTWQPLLLRTGLGTRGPVSPLASLTATVVPGP